MTLRRSVGVDLVLLAAIKALVGAWALRRGFSHVSDDDFARVVIAQSFAAAPKLDPSGTSWLPFPFWVTGAAMMALGRSLAVARAVAFASGIAGAWAVYLALRTARVGRWVALAGVVAAMATPWSAWLGVATVPEALTGALIAAAAIAASSRRARPWAAAALFAASLSRYEAWPVCGVVAAVAIAAAVRERDGRAALADVATAMLAASGPLLWMAWNAHAHGSAMHFVARVAAYRQAIGAAQIPLIEKLLGYPRALMSSATDVVLLAAAGTLGLRDAELRRRWALPLASMAAMLAFLIYGDVRDGAPTHHPERALTAMWWVLAAFGVDGVAAFGRRFAWARPRREMFVVGAAAACAVAWIAGVAQSLNAPPGRDPEERRETQIARGEELRARGVEAFTVKPCAYEHYAVMAAYGAPERVTVISGLRRTIAPSCPRIETPAGR